MSEETRLFQRLHPGVTSEQARDVRARAWAFVFECWHTKKGGHHDLTHDVAADWRKQKVQGKARKEKT